MQILGQWVDLKYLGDGRLRWMLSEGEREEGEGIGEGVVWP